MIMKLNVGSHKKLIILSFLFFFITGLSQAKDTIKLITNSPINNNGPSKDCNVEICTSLLELINSANKTIDFAIYGLRGQDEILQALINAEKRGVKVRGITDKTLEGKSYYTDTHLIAENLKNVRNDHKVISKELNITREEFTMNLNNAKGQLIQKGHYSALKEKAMQVKRK